MTGPREAFSTLRQDWGPASAACRFPHDAMGTTFEIIILGEDRDYAQAAARAAFDELDGLERELSRFVETSDVSRISRLGAGEPVRVGVGAFECLELASRVHEETGGAFDVSIGRLLSCWLSREGRPRTPSEDELARAGERVGMRWVTTNEQDHSVGLGTSGVELDLGGIGKGYALDRMAALLGEWSIETALLHAGESSFLAVGSPPGEEGWLLGLRDPEDDARSLGSVRLRDRAVSGSGRLLRGRHIIDPRTGLPAEGALSAWAAAPTAALSDALSTAFMVMSAGEVEEYCRRRPEASGALLPAGPEGRRMVRFGERDEFAPN